MQELLIKAKQHKKNKAAKSGRFGKTCHPAYLGVAVVAPELLFLVAFFAAFFA
jgi:hypothetical protein